MALFSKAIISLFSKAVIQGGYFASNIKTVFQSSKLTVDRNLSQVNRCDDGKDLGL